MGHPTAFAMIMEAIEDAGKAARFFDGDKLRDAAQRLTAIAETFPPDCDCGCVECDGENHCNTPPCWEFRDWLAAKENEPPPPVPQPTFWSRLRAKLTWKVAE